MQYAMAPGRFSTGKYGMMIDGSWSLSQIRAAEPNFEVGSFLLPTNDDASKNINMCYKTGGGFSVTAGTGKEELGKRFIEFHMRDSVLQKYSDMCMMGPVKSNLENKDPLSKVFYSNSNYNYISLAENTFVRGMPGFTTSEILNLFTGRTTASALCDSLNKTHLQYSSIWAANVTSWIRTHYPDRIA